MVGLFVGLMLLLRFIYLGQLAAPANPLDGTFSVCTMCDDPGVSCCLVTPRFSQFITLFTLRCIQGVISSPIVIRQQHVERERERVCLCGCWTTCHHKTLLFPSSSPTARLPRHFSPQDLIIQPYRTNQTIDY